MGLGVAKEEAASFIEFVRGHQHDAAGIRRRQGGSIDVSSKGKDRHSSIRPEAPPADVGMMPGPPDPATAAAGAAGAPAGASEELRALRLLVEQMGTMMKRLD